MLTTKTERETWLPETAADRDFVLTQVDGVLRSPQFSSSKRYPAFLSYVVEQTLVGNASQIKERTIGVEVFGRSTDYDTNSDTVVRYTAGEVRKRLAIYYHEHAEAPLEIMIPQGTYAPEFRRAQETLKVQPEQEPIAGLSLPTIPGPSTERDVPQADTVAASPWRSMLLSFALLALVIAGAFWIFRHVQATRTTAVDRFWKPVLQDRGIPLLVPGVVVFSPNPYSGTETAGKSAEYPFVSVQVAASLARLTGLLQKNGSSYQLQAANGTTLSDLRDRSVILVGAYNNEWTKRLLQDSHYHLDDSKTPAILDSTDPKLHWSRDHTLPYASSDDYALIGRFRDTTTGSLIVVIAGLGRNGTEAAAEFLTDPQYMAQLESRVGHAIGDGNLEAVLKINVVDGKTGAPSLQAVTTW